MNTYKDTYVLPYVYVMDTYKDTYVSPYIYVMDTYKDTYVLPEVCVSFVSLYVCLYVNMCLLCPYMYAYM